VQVTPTELVLKPGGTVQFRVRLFDENARFIRDAPSGAAWSLEQLTGTVTEGKFTAAPNVPWQAGLVKATVDGVAGEARVRVLAPLPINETFEKLPTAWINLTGKYVTRELEGNPVLVKLADNAFTKRARTFLGPSDWHDYTVQTDFRAIEKRRQMGDAGVVAQRYALVLFGNAQKLEIQPWQPETARTVSKPFPWKSDIWYRMKLRVENTPDGKARAQGKVWPAAEPEPAAWTIERIDPIPNKTGSPGIYADASFEIFFDNVKVTANQ
jgi:hypothetical protein